MFIIFSFEKQTDKFMLNKMQTCEHQVRFPEWGVLGWISNLKIPRKVTNGDKDLFIVQAHLNVWLWVLLCLSNQTA